MPAAKPRKSVALALGGGGARSLAQILVLEALDDMGVKPVALAGASFGAVIAAAYAAGMSGRAIRRAVLKVAHDRGVTLSRLLAARATTLSAWISAPLGNPLLLDTEKLCASFLPPEIPEDFRALGIPLTVIATDLFARDEAALTTGALKSAIAGSIAIPGLMRPVERDGRMLVDGAVTNPLPFDHLRGTADIVVAVDASVGLAAARGVPDPWEALGATIHVIGHDIVSRKLREGEPDLLLRPAAGTFRLLDFFLASAILRAAEPVKAEVKERLGALLAR
jgi:NTE family protein